jgi:hypothetical protein
MASQGSCVKGETFAGSLGVRSATNADTDFDILHDVRVVLPHSAWGKAERD